MGDTGPPPKNGAPVQRGKGKLAQHDVVVVSVNHRLNILGFLDQFFKLVDLILLSTFVSV